MTEIDHRAEQLTVLPQLLGRGVGEADGNWSPACTEKSGQQSHCHSHGQFDELAGFHRFAKVGFYADRRWIVQFVNARPQRLVVHVLIAGQDAQRMADIGLFANDQAQWTQVGELPTFSQP